MHKLYFFILPILIFMTTTINCNSQDFVRRIDLHVIPLHYVFKKSILPSEVKKNAKVKITLKESMIKLEMHDFLNLIKEIDEKSNEEIAEDYRIVCIIRKFIGKEILYFNQFGDFKYKGKTYKNELLKSFVFDHLPESCK